jgi:Rrf2 family transcriptional regulator, nitric oxide-sensitive transcriptional repressor
MISLTAEYALRAVVLLANDPEEALGTRAIAEASQSPVGYMSKVLQALSKMGLVTSRPGRTGGFMLARPAGAISVLEVVNAVDPIRRITQCPLEKPGHQDHLCPLHSRLDSAAAMVEKSFRDSTIADLVADPVRPAPLCGATRCKSAPSVEPVARMGEPLPVIPRAPDAAAPG